MKMHKHTIANREQGLSLVELMIAITIGLFLTAAIVSLYVSNATSFRMQDDSARMQESMRGALDTLNYHIRQAGYVDVATDIGFMTPLTAISSKNFYMRQGSATTDDQLAKFFGKKATQYKTGTNYIHGLSGCKGLYTSTSFTTFPWACTTAGPSSMTLSYQAQPSSFATPGTVRAVQAGIDSLGAYNATTGAGGDCAGKDVNGASASPKGPLAINRFYVDTSSKRLMCMGNGDPGVAKPIAEGVEDMLILYGITPTTVSATAQNDSFAGRYVEADSVTDWSDVLSIRVCLVFVSSKKIASSVTSYKNCAGTSVTTTDGLLRQISRATFTLRNNVFTIPDALLP